MRISLLAGLLLAGATLCAQAAYPDKPITFVSAFAPGATNDFLTRFVARGVAAELHGSEVVENRPGANGIVGTNFVARAKPDGYTVLMGNGASHGIDPTLYPEIPYDALKDFQGVSMVASVPLVLLANAALPANNLKELIAYGNAHPGKLSFASSGIGSTGHLAGEALVLAAHLDMVHVPYKGDAPAVTDTMAGTVPLSVVALSAVTPLLATGKVKVLAVASPKRLALLPAVQTIDESGYPGMDFSVWFAIVAPSATPKPVIDTLNLAIKGVLASAATKTSFETQGAEPVYTTPAQTQAFIKSEIERFGAVIRQLNLQLH
ncbi:MAG TPA: tripartite tricarboxylate transporter substrate binding protein [Burkholderiaceae bacterium]|jgi:tripartite-type tricarboxylate transporter receptor subunit TctC